jgi:hypothetical protein
LDVTEAEQRAICQSLPQRTFAFQGSEERCYQATHEHSRG